MPTAVIYCKSNNLLTVTFPHFKSKAKVTYFSVRRKKIKINLQLEHVKIITLHIWMKENSHAKPIIMGTDQ